MPSSLTQCIRTMAELVIQTTHFRLSLLWTLESSAFALF